jgi:hypothetical protein
MNIQDLVYDVIVEEVKNKKLFNFLLNKWFGETPTPEQIQQAENDLTLFIEKQKSLTVNNPAVYTFLLRHDGNHGLPAFDPSKIMDISQYSLEEIESLLHEFKDATLTAGDDDEFKGKLDSTPGKIAASKKLWLTDRDTVVNEEGFKVHFVTDAREAIKYGFYQQAMSKAKGGLQWCVTGRNTSDSRSNLWGHYRPSRTFWFVIDESKNPEDNPSPDVHKYYICALQYCERDDHYTGFKMTSMLNDGDIKKTWEEVVRIYPQLSEHRDLFEYRNFEEAELFDKNVANRLTETSGIYEFAAARRELKKSFLEGGGVISTEKSWKSMDVNLRNLYILTTTARNVLDKYQTTEFMSVIRQVGNEYRLLDSTLKSLGNRNNQQGILENESLGKLGVGYIYQHLMKTEFSVGRTSLDNPQLKLFKSIKTKKFGLYDLQKIKWVTVDGITFEPNYSEELTLVYEDDQGKQYLVETYIIDGGQIDNTTLYLISPVLEENDMAGGHFIAASKFKELSKKIHPKNENDDEDIVKIKDFNPETDVDIKEIY